MNKCIKFIDTMEIEPEKRFSTAIEAIRYMEQIDDKDYHTIDTTGMTRSDREILAGYINSKICKNYNRKCIVKDKGFTYE